MPPKNKAVAAATAKKQKQQEQQQEEQQEQQEQQDADEGTLESAVNDVPVSNAETPTEVPVSVGPTLAEIVARQSAAAGNGNEEEDDAKKNKAGRGRKGAAATAAAAAKEKGAGTSSTSTSTSTSTSSTGTHFSSFQSTPDRPVDKDGKDGKDVAGPSTLTFDVTGIPLCVVNAARRAILSDVPNVAFAMEATDSSLVGRSSTVSTFQRQRAAQAANQIAASKVSNHSSSATGPSAMRFIANTTTLHNELLGHRIGLVPIALDENQLHAFQSHRFKFVFRAKNTERHKTVDATSADIAVYDGATDQKMPTALRDAMFPPSQRTGDHILLAKLRPAGTNGMTTGEEVHVEMHAVLGVGRDHARFVPVSSCFFRNKTDVAAAERDLRAQLEKLSVNSGADVLESDRAILRSQHAALQAPRFCIPNAYEFTITSETRLRPAYLFFRALQVLVARLQSTRTAIGTIADVTLASAESDPLVGVDPEQSNMSRDGLVRLATVANMDDMFHLWLYDDDHTMGNLIQGMLYEKWIVEEDADRVAYVGYHMPHPQERIVMVILRLARPGPEIRELLQEGLAYAATRIRTLMHEFILASGLDKMGVAAVQKELAATSAK